MEADAAHASALNRKGLQQAAAAALESLGADDNLLPDRSAADVDKAAVVPVAVREQYAGYFAALVLRPIEIAGHKKAGHALEIDLLDRVVAFVGPTVNH